MKNEKFSNYVSRLFSLKSEIISIESEVKQREAEYFSMENSLKKALLEKTLKPENIIQARGDLEKKKTQLIFMKKNW